MKLEIDRKDLVEALRNLDPAVAKRSPLPVLAGIKLEANQGRLALEATDLELAIRLHLEANVIEEGSAVVPTKQLVRATKAMSGTKVMLSSEEAGPPALTLTSDSKTISIEVLAVEDWPTSDVDLVWRHVSIVDSKNLTDALKSVVLCASDEEGRPVLTGVQIIFEKDSHVAELVATDSYRLGVVKVEMESLFEVPEPSPIVPARVLRSLSKCLPRHAGPVNLYVGDPGTGHRRLMVEFPFGAARWMTREIEGEFPNWRRLIPAEAQGGRLECEANELGEAVRDAAGFRSDNNVPVRIGLEETCTLRMIDGHSVRLEQTLTQATYSPNGTGPMEIAFNPDFLKDAVDFAGAERVVMWVTNPCKPALFTGDPNRRHVLMPVRLP